jgi:hypothetical protein
MTEWKPTEQNIGQPVKPSGDNLPTSSYAINLPKQSNWTCYMFGNRPDGMEYMLYSSRRTSAK